MTLNFYVVLLYCTVPVLAIELCTFETIKCLKSHGEPLGLGLLVPNLWPINRRPSFGWLMAKSLSETLKKRVLSVD